MSQSSARSNTRRTLKLEVAPEVRCLKLGQELDVVKKKVPEIMRSFRATPPPGERDPPGVRTWDLTGQVVFSHLDNAKYAD